jgi:hypothetical protein
MGRRTWSVWRLSGLALATAAATAAAIADPKPDEK